MKPNMSFYRALHCSFSNNRCRNPSIRLSGSVAGLKPERSPGVGQASKLRLPGDKNCLKPIGHNQNTLVKTPRSLINVEKKLGLFPPYVIHFYLEDDILKAISERATSTNNKSSEFNVLQQTPHYKGNVTAMEFRKMVQNLRQAAMRIKLPSFAPAKVSRPLLPFVTIRSTLRHRGVPRAEVSRCCSSATTRYKHTYEKITASASEDSTQKRGTSKVKEAPFVEGSINDGSFTKVTRMDIGRRLDNDPKSASFVGAVKGLAKSIQEVKGEVDSVDNDVTGSVGGKGLPGDDILKQAKEKLTPRQYSSMKEFIKYQAPQKYGPPTPIMKYGIPAPDKRTKAPMKYALPAPDMRTEAPKKYGQPAPLDYGPPAADRRTEAPLKACAIITQKGALTDAKTLIACNKSAYAPRSLLDLKECVEYQYNDHRTLATLQKIKAIKLREIEHHKAQIKRHRKELLELMFKAPFQKQEEDPAKTPKPDLK